MRRLISLLACTLIVLAPATEAQRADVAPWSVYTIKGEDFSVALPTLPAMQISKETRARPQKDRRRRVLKSSVKGIVYTIHIVENPKPRLSLDTFIQEQATINPAGNLTSERNLTLDGIAGKAFVYADGKGMVQFFATEDRLYDVRAYGASVDDTSITKFFSSLSLKKKKEGVDVPVAALVGPVVDPAERIYIGKDVDTKARLLKKPEPTYSDKARSKQITGTIVLRCIFAADGTVSNIRVIQGLPYGLTEKSIEAARKIKFVPATKDGKPVSMWMQLEYNFNLF